MERIIINIGVTYLNQRKMSARKNQDKPLRDLNWTSSGLEFSLTGKNQNKSWSDLSEPEKMSTGKNQDKPLRDLNWTSRGLWIFFNWNKNQRDLSVDLTEPEMCLIHFAWTGNHKNLRIDSTEPDKSLGIPSTGIGIRDILVSISLN